jgi:hypothetical protein
VAGIAASADATLRGVAPQARLLPIQVFSRFTQQAYCFPYTAPCVLSFASDQVEALVSDFPFSAYLVEENRKLIAGVIELHLQCEKHLQCERCLHELGFRAFFHAIIL